MLVPTDKEQQIDDFLMFDDEIRKILSTNLILRLLLRGRYFWFVLAITLAIGYFAVGGVIGSITGTLNTFLWSRPVYVLLTAITACVFYACWYPRLILEVITATPRVFKVTCLEVTNLTKNWMKYIFLPIPIAMGVIMAVGGVIVLMATRQVFPSFASVPLWLNGYIYILIAICGVMLGGGLQVFIATIFLLHKLFQFEINLPRYRYLSSLGSLSAGLSTAGFIAVALFILLVFDGISFTTWILAAAGAMISAIMFIVPQVSYHKAATRTKKTSIGKLGVLYERYYQIIEDDTVDSKMLQDAKQAIEALGAIEKSIKNIPSWLVDLTNVVQVLLSLLAPIGSMVINAVLSRII